MKLIRDTAREVVNSGLNYEEAMEQFRTAYVIEALLFHGGNECRTGAAIGIHRNSISRILAIKGLDVAQVRAYLPKKPRKPPQPSTPQPELAAVTA